MCTIHLLSLTAAHMPKHLLSEVSEKCAGEKNAEPKHDPEPLHDTVARTLSTQSTPQSPRRPHAALKPLSQPHVVWSRLFSQALSIRTSVSYPLIWKDPNFSGTKGRKSPLYFFSSTCLES